MAGKIIADTIQAAGDRITFNVGEVTVMTANSAGLTYIPTANINLNIANPGAITTGNLAVTNIVTSSLVPANSNINIGSSGTTWNIGYFNGIKFPSGQQASADANTLDDYEEGTWSPIFVSSGATFTLGTQYGSYTKVGRLVYANFYLRCTGITGSGSSMAIGGLPFTSATTTYQGGTVILGYVQNWQSLTYAQMFGYVTTNGTTASLLQGNYQAGLANLGTANMSTGGSGTYMIGICMYEASA